MSLTEFQDYVENKLAEWTKLIGEGDSIEDKCSIDYETPLFGQEGYADPE